MAPPDNGDKKWNVKDVATLIFLAINIATILWNTATDSAESKFNREATNNLTQAVTQLRTDLTALKIEYAERFARLEERTGIKK